MDFKYIGFIYFSFSGYIKRSIFFLSSLPLLLSLFILERLNAEVNLKMTSSSYLESAIPPQVEKLAVIFCMFCIVFLTVCPLAKRVRDAGGNVSFWIRLYLVFNILLSSSYSVLSFLLPYFIKEGFFHPYWLFSMIILEFIFFFCILLVLFYFFFQKTNPQLVQNLGVDELSPLE